MYHQNPTSQPLLHLLSLDQEVLKLYTGGKIDLAEFKKKNQEIIGEFKKYIEEYGFPFKNKNAYEVYKAGVALALHAEPEFLKSIGKVFEKATPAEVDPDHLAYFVDKIRLYENKPQIYGTQFKRLPDGSVEFFPIENSENVDETRNKIGLTTLEEYKNKAESRN